MAKADFIHQIETHAGRNVLTITDLDLGNKSVTNDIDNVIAEIAKMERIDPNNYMIVYADSEGNWDGYDFEQKQFVGLGCDNWKDAVSKYVKIQLSQAVKSAWATM